MSEGQNSFGKFAKCYANFGYHRILWPQRKGSQTTWYYARMTQMLIRKHWVTCRIKN